MFKEYNRIDEAQNHSKSFRDSRVTVSFTVDVVNTVNIAIVRASCRLKSVAALSILQYLP
jgi:hypothetical protein